MLSADGPPMHPPTPLDLLRAALAAGLLGACGDPCTRSLPGRLVRTVGYLEVEPGDPCPEASDDLSVAAGTCSLQWAGTTCGFVGRGREGVVSDDYGGWTASTRIEGEPVDLCEYEAVFEPTGYTCGRPLLVGDQPIVADVVADPSWADGPLPDLRGLSDADRQRLGEAWLAAAQLEHASVASFARFALDLLRIGAPPELIRDAHDAALDEVRHARLCFGLASAYLGRRVGPGRLPVDEVVLSGDRADFAEAVVREGCVGESLAAIDAAARRSLARDPAIRDVLATIEADEARHAALAWRTLAWLLATDDGAVRARVAPLLGPTEEVSAPSVEVTATVAHGLLDPVDAATIAGLARAAVAATWAGLASAA